MQVSYIGRDEVGRQAKQAAVSLVSELRKAGIGAVLPFGDRSLKSQLKSANRAEVAFVVIIGEGELASGQLTVRSLADGQQQPVERAAVVAWLQAGLRPNGWAQSSHGKQPTPTAEICAPYAASVSCTIRGSRNSLPLAEQMAQFI